MEKSNPVIMTLTIAFAMTLSLSGLTPLFISSASASSVHSPSVVARINGGGLAEMQPGPDVPFPAGDSSWGTGVTLFSDGTATGHLDCVDQHGDAPGFPGNLFGQATSWSVDSNGVISVTFVGEGVNFPGTGPVGHPSPVTFVVAIQQFGGPGVGRWTLSVLIAPNTWFTFCYELIISGQIVYAPAN